MIMDETVIDLLQMEDAVFSPFPVGRLDKDTEGLLLIQTMGNLPINYYHLKSMSQKHILLSLTGK